MNLTDNFIRSLYELSHTPLSNILEKAVRRCFLDYLGATIAGAKMLGSRGERMIEMLGEGGDCSIIGFRQKASLHTATFVNGFSSHTAELDDGVISGIIHPGAPIFSALLSVAEKNGCSYKKFILGAFIGYEASVRLANAIQPGHKLLGYHASGTCGLIGAAIAVGVMLGQNEKELKNTFAAAIASVHGSLKVLEDGSELKPFNIASAASDAVVAALVSSAGFEGADNPLEGYAGFFAQLAGGKVDFDKLYRKDGQTFAIEDVYVKPYAACRYCHPSIENALKLRDKIKNIEDIEQVVIKTYELAVNKHDMTEVANVSAAKMSIPFATAVSFFKGSASVDAYTDETVANKKVNDLMKKVKVYPEPNFSKVFPEKSIATMDLKMKDGLVFSERTDAPKGEADIPLTDGELQDKFITLALFAGYKKNIAVNLSKEILFGNESIHHFLSYLS